MATMGPPPDDPTPTPPAPSPAPPQPSAQPAPSGAPGMLSPDGRWVWDGRSWQPNTGAPPPGYGPPQGYAPPSGAGYPVAPYPAYPMAAVPVVPCPSCGQPFGPHFTCQYCGQVSNLPVGVRLSSVGRRLGAYLLDGLLAIVTLLIGWFIWSLIVWKDGQSPAKRLLGMRVANKDTGAPASWGRMFLREFVAKVLIVGVALGIFTFGIVPLILDFMLLWDKIATTLVVDDPRPVPVAPPMVTAVPGASSPGSGSPTGG